MITMKSSSLPRMKHLFNLKLQESSMGKVYFQLNFQSWMLDKTVDNSKEGNSDMGIFYLPLSFKVSTG